MKSFRDRNRDNRPRQPAKANAAQSHPREAGAATRQEPQGRPEPKSAPRVLARREGAQG
ncbi:MAG: class I SAM-dependent rRNA methyltransferase, partial [Mesorhizobium sp.]